MFVNMVALKRKALEWQFRARMHGRKYTYAKRLADEQWLSKKRTDELQRKRLGRLLHHASVSVPFYTESFREAGLCGRDGRIDLDCFRHLPILDKVTLVDRHDDFRSADLDQRRWYCNASGGSTGEPVKVLQDKEYLDRSLAIKMTHISWLRVQPGAKTVNLWGSERDVFRGREKLSVRFSWWLRNVVWLNSFRMTRTMMRQYVGRINKVRPEVILAYVESAYELARFIEDEGLSVHRPKAVMSAAGTLHDVQRELIERVFGAPVFNRYGSREVGDMACECDQHRGLHVSTPTHYIEIVRDGGTAARPGEIGEVLVTLLTNFAMPLIRYRIGDLAAWSEEPCTCGRAWPLLKSVVGRVTDTFLTAKGTRIHGEYFTHLFYFRDWIRQFQVVQVGYDEILLKVVLKDGMLNLPESKKYEVQEIEQKTRLVMGPACRIDWQVTSEISPTASGKRRYTISKVVA